MKQYKVRTTSKRDIDRIVDLEAKNEKELSKIVFGLDFGNGTPDDYDIIEQKEKKLRIFIDGKEIELLDLLNDRSYYRDNDLNIEGIATGKEWYEVLTDVEEDADDTYLVSVKIDKAYVIMETKGADRFEEILPDMTTLEEAKEKARKAKECIVAADRATIELAYVDVTEDGIIDPCNNGYNPIPF